MLRVIATATAVLLLSCASVPTKEQVAQLRRGMLLTDVREVLGADNLKSDQTLTCGVNDHGRGRVEMELRWVRERMMTMGATPALVERERTLVAQLSAMPPADTSRAFTCRKQVYGRDCVLWFQQQDAFWLLTNWDC